MLAKKAPRSRTAVPQYRKRLQYLYARKSNIESLIRFLEQYDRFQAGDRVGNRRKTA